MDERDKPLGPDRADGICLREPELPSLLGAVTWPRFAALLACFSAVPSLGLINMIPEAPLSRIGEMAFRNLVSVSCIGIYPSFLRLRADSGQRSPLAPVERQGDRVRSARRRRTDFHVT